MDFEIDIKKIAKCYIEDIVNMDDLQVKNDKRRLIITSKVIIIILLLVGFGVLRLFYYAYENTMKDRMID